MGDVRAFVLAIGAVLIGLGLLLGWINYKIDKLKEEDKLNIDMIGSIIALEKAMKKLNAALKIHEHRLDHERDEIYGINKRLDILEEGHPDTDIDYGEVDDHGEVVCVWFEGKKYVPEDKLDENTSTFYADNKVVAETTRPDPHPESGYKCSDCVRFRRERIDGKWCGICSVDNVVMSDDEQYICDKFRLYKPTGEITKPEETRCCATCQHYCPGSGYSTCNLRTWLHVTKQYATMADSACNNYEKTSAVLVPSDKDKVEYVRFDKKIDDLQLKIDYITLCQEQDKLRNKEIGFNKLLSSAMQSGIMSAREWREFMEDLDSDT